MEPSIQRNNLARQLFHGVASTEVFPALLGRAQSRSTASSLCAGAQVYVPHPHLNFLCPINEATIVISTPAITRRLANVWRRLCHAKSLMPALLGESSNQ